MSSRLAENLSALRTVALAEPFSAGDAAKANFRVSATLTAIDDDALVPGLTTCQRTKDLGSDLAMLLEQAHSAVELATRVSTGDARTQRQAAAELFGLLPDVLKIAEANAKVAGELGLTGQVAVVPTDVDRRPLGSLPPLPTPTPGVRPTSAPSDSGNEGLPSALTSTYFSGYGAQHYLDDVTSISGSWTQPKGTCDGSKSTAFGAWVGIQNAVNLQQIGTAVECQKGSSEARYYVWYEMFPKIPVRVAMRASPGDKFTASVSRAGSKWTLRIKNGSTGDHFATDQDRDTAGYLALWIDEAPSSQVAEVGHHVLPLTKVGKVTMTGCSATVGDVSRPIGSSGWAHYRFDMITADGVSKATTSGLGPGGSSFTMTWRHY